MIKEIDYNYDRNTSIMKVMSNMVPRFIFCGAQYTDIEKVLKSVCDRKGWCNEWMKLGDEYEKLAQEAEEDNFLVSAKEYYLLASNCYRTSHTIIYATTEKKISLYKKEMLCFQKAAKHFEGHFEKVQITFGETEVSGYLWKPMNVEKPPCTLVIHGADSTKEEYFTQNEYFIKRGIAVLIIDGPGQGESILFSNMHMDNNFEKVAKAAVDFLEKREDIDISRIAIAGQCMGAYQALRSAAIDDRFKACVAISPFYYLESWTKESVPMALKKMVIHVYNLKGYDELKEFAPTISLDKVLHNIKCPVMVMHGGKDVFVEEGDVVRIVEEINAIKKFIVYPDGVHALLNHFKESRIKMADWIYSAFNE
ncbi:alpha/beta hydrolase family protein [Clostridium beijerinckii]|uniref:2,6-dihydropseudooxynicotine hydrolase n=1 Tax=Clostridium beijerinckii TaxID=1520 RepID=A0A1S8SJX4_CLOBE|nr:alpha/beta fold hydrolase [Clostridium beijerinckii]NRY61557.1 dipeptidyl aminopeptidase/acylaminoacyl peptidase [Clostridium beijerinckii]OOM65848.1 2,6-dihydropseudooxynicotine hydrolase [Clostridium beijerinckii]